MNTDLIIVLHNLLIDHIALKVPVLDARLLPLKPHLDVNKLPPLSLLSEYPQLPIKSLKGLVLDPLNGKELRVEVDILLPLLGGVGRQDQVTGVLFF